MTLWPWSSTTLKVSLKVICCAHAHANVKLGTWKPEKERHIGGFDIVHIRDVLGRDFSTRLGNVFVIGSEGKPMISMPRGGGVALTITEERDQRRRQKEARGQ